MTAEAKEENRLLLVVRSVLVNSMADEKNINSISVLTVASEVFGGTIGSEGYARSRVRQLLFRTTWKKSLVIVY